MGVLAMATYWLARMTPVITVPEVAVTPLHENDYFMRQFSLRTYAAHGRLQSEVIGVRHVITQTQTRLKLIRCRFALSMRTVV